MQHHNSKKQRRSTQDERLEKKDTAKVSTVVSPIF